MNVISVQILIESLPFGISWPIGVTICSSFANEWKEFQKKLSIYCNTAAKVQMIQKSVEGTEELKLYTIFSQLGPSRHKVLEE